MMLMAKKSLTNFRENVPSQKFHWVLNTLRVLKCSQIALVNRVSSQRKVEKHFGHRSENSEGPLEDVLGTYQISLPETSLKRQIRTSSGRHFRTSPGRQIGTSPGRQIRTSLGQSNRIFRGRPGDVGGGCPQDVLGTNICRLDNLFRLLENATLKIFSI